MHTVVFSSQYHRISCSPLEVLLDLHNYTGLGEILRPFFLVCDSVMSQLLSPGI